MPRRRSKLNFEDGDGNVINIDLTPLPTLLHPLLFCLYYIIIAYLFKAKISAGTKIYLFLLPDHPVSLCLILVAKCQVKNI